MAVRRSSVKRTVGPALYRAMEPGDRIIAGTWAVRGPTPWLEMLGIIAVEIVLAVAPSTTGVTLGRPFGDLVSLAPLVLLVWRRPVFVAVTHRQLVCYRLSRMNNAPVRLLFCAPLLSTRVTYLGRPFPRWRSIRYDGPGAEGGSLRLNVVGSWRKDLDEVLAALQAQGGGVEGLSPEAAARAAPGGRLETVQEVLTQPSAPSAPSARFRIGSPSESPVSSTGVLRRVMRDTRPPDDPRQSPPEHW